MNDEYFLHLCHGVMYWSPAVVVPRFKSNESAFPQAFWPVCRLYLHHSRLAVDSLRVCFLYLYNYSLTAFIKHTGATQKLSSTGQIPATVLLLAWPMSVDVGWMLKMWGPPSWTPMVIFIAVCLFRYISRCV